MIYDIALIGIGSSGAFFAKGLTGTKKSVALIEAGPKKNIINPKKIKFRNSGISLNENLSPRLKFHRSIIKKYGKLEKNFHPNAFTYIHLKILGGLGNIWGGAITFLNKNDFGTQQYENIKDLLNYRNTINVLKNERKKHNLISTSKITSPLFEIYNLSKEKCKLKHFFKKIHHLVSPKNKKEIFNPITILKRHPLNSKSKYYLNTGVTGIKKTKNYFQLHLKNKKKEFKITAKKVFLAAGVVESARIISYLYSRKINLLLRNSPTSRCCFFYLGKLCNIKSHYNVSQLRTELRVKSEGEKANVQVLFYPFGNLKVSTNLDILDQAINFILKYIKSRLLIALLYYPGKYSRNSLVVKKGKILKLNGYYQKIFPTIEKSTSFQLKKKMAQLRTFYIPFSWKRLTNGSESHVGCTFPFISKTNAKGELKENPGIFLCDSSILPEIPSKLHTWSAMTIAYNLGLRNL